MNPSERAIWEASYLARRSTEARVQIGLHVSSSGALLAVIDPSTGRMLWRSTHFAPASPRAFQAAVDQAIISALM